MVEKISITNKLTDLSFGFRIAVAGLIMMVFLISYGLFACEQFATHLSASRSEAETAEIIADMKSINADLSNLSALERTYFISHDSPLLQNLNAIIEGLNVSKNTLNTVAAIDVKSRRWKDDLVPSLDARIRLAKSAIENYRAMNLIPTQLQLQAEALCDANIKGKADLILGNAKEHLSSYVQNLESTSFILFCCMWAFRFAALVTFAFCLFLVVRYILETRSMANLLRSAETASAEKAARLNAIVETAPDGILTLNCEGQIESANQACEPLFGYRADELIGKNIRQIVPTFSMEDGQADFTLLKPGERKVLETGQEDLALKKGEVRIPIEFSLSILSLGDSKILTMIVRDITERREAQNRVKNFYSAVSHELRTPLSSIRTALGLIEDGTANGDAQEHSNIIQIAQTESDRLIRLINDLLDIRKIEEGKLILNYQSVKPDQLIDTALSGIKAIANQANVGLEKQCYADGQFYCDPDRIVQVLSNLLANAIKFSPSGQTVLVSCHQDQQFDSLIFSVTDNGPGITHSEMSKLFGQFEQLNLGPNNKHGSGLGLAISKSIVEHHRGHIYVETNQPTGCRFWFELPAGFPTEENLAETSELPPITKVP